VGTGVTGWAHLNSDQDGPRGPEDRLRRGGPGRVSTQDLDFVGEGYLSVASAGCHMIDPPGS
jgi:hypothetical protein